MKKAIIFATALLMAFAFTACVSIAPSQAPQTPTSPSLSVPASAPPTETPAPSPTEEPPETPDHAGTGDVLFDIYKKHAQVDLNGDGTPEDVRFQAGAESFLTINGTPYQVEKPNLDQLFAIVDVDKNDKHMEILFTNPYDAALTNAKKIFSHLYWWDGAAITFMGGLLDVKYSGEWRKTLKADDIFDGKGQVACLTDTKHFTHVWYMGHYKPEGKDRKLDEVSYTTKPVAEVGKVICKKPCLLLSSITTKYYSSEFDYYWIPTLSPYTLGRVPDVSEGIKIIAQTGERLSIVGVYGKHWFKLKTDDGYQGWIKCEDKKVKVYDFTMGWDANDMFEGLED